MNITTLPNPCIGPDADKTFGTQRTFVFPVPDKPGSFIYQITHLRP